MKQKQIKKRESHSIEMSIPLASDLSPIQKRDFLIGLFLVLEDIYGCYALGFAIESFLESKLNHK